MHDQLYNVPPRIMDLPPEELRKALIARHHQSTANWLRDREYRSPMQRLADWFEGKVVAMRKVGR